MLNRQPNLAFRQVSVPNAPPTAFSRLLQMHLERDTWEVFLKKTASAEGGPREKFLEYEFADFALCTAYITTFAHFTPFARVTQMLLLSLYISLCNYMHEYMYTVFAGTRVT